MKITIVTVSRNSEKTIEDTIRSVEVQTYKDVEHIIVDGESTDGTMEIVKKHSHAIAKCISEKDAGIYDAMNKGINLSTGEIIGILNSDDMLQDSKSLQRVADGFKLNDADAVIADIVMVDPINLQKIKRYYRSNRFTIKLFQYGMMPPHPSFFVKRQCYVQYGGYRTNYRIAADFELLLRFLAVHKIKYTYLPWILVRMRSGGMSTRSLKSNWILNKEIIEACRNHGIKTNYLMVYSKYIVKAMQLIDRPK